MKHCMIFSLCSLLLLGMNGWAQTPMYLTKPPDASNTDAPMECPPNTIYSQVPFYPSISGNIEEPRRIADDFVALTAPTSMRFWGMDILNTPGPLVKCTPPEITFIVRFYKRNPSDPTIPGVEIASYTIVAVPQYMPIWGANNYQIDLVFPEKPPIVYGWVSLSRLNTDDPCSAFWHGYDAFGEGGNSCYFEDGVWHPAIPWEFEFEMAFCFGGQLLVPLSNWALIIGLVLIGTLTIIRYRRA